MVTKLHGTLADAFEGREELLERIVVSSVMKAAEELGDKVHDVEWANSNARRSLASGVKAA